MKPQIQFIGITPEEFIEQVKKSVMMDIERSLYQRFKSKPPTEYLTRKEVYEALKIDPSTLHKYTEKGIIQSFKIEGRVLYKRSDIDSLPELMQTQNIKGKLKITKADSSNINEIFEKVKKLVQEGTTISKALILLNTNNATFYKNITPEQKSELKITKTANTKFNRRQNETSIVFDEDI